MLRLFRRSAAVAAGAVGALAYIHSARDQNDAVLLRRAQCSQKAYALHRYSVADAVAKAAPAVVNIAAQGSEIIVGPFGNIMSNSASGSGFIIESSEKEAYVVTNAHVVTNSNGHLARDISVTLADERVLHARVAHVDPTTDICLLKVACTSALPVVELGTSAELRPGELIAVIGSPLMLSNSISMGVVSNVRRPVAEIHQQGLEPGMEYIQTDAAVNVGNSGGPVINLDGEVVGIASMKMESAHNSVDGIGFAIPMDFARIIVDQLRKFGRVRRPYVGVKLMTLTPALTQHVRQHVTLPEEVKDGVLVFRVQRDSPAFQAGLQAKDIIIAANGKKITSTPELITALTKNIDSGISITVIRGLEGKRVELSLKPEEQDFKGHL